MRDASGFKYFLSDHLGSVSVVLSATGTVLEQQRYLPFGQARIMPPYASVTSTDFTYTGQRNLPDTGLMDYRARFYSPALGRFIQPDTVIPGVANPQSWNRFSYVTNNPIGYTDPTGHRPVEDEFNGGKKGCSDPKYCRDGKPKPEEELKKMRNQRDNRDDEGDWPDNPPWDSNPVPLQKLDLIDLLFNPWAGPSYQMAFMYPDDYQQYRAGWRELMSHGMYGDQGFDTLRTNVFNAAPPPDSNQNPIDNPLSPDKYVGMEGSMLMRPGWEPYSIFLGKLGLGTGQENAGNYEPYFLEALMNSHPAELQAAKDDWLLNHSLSPDNATIQDFMDKNFCMACDA